MAEAAEDSTDRTGWATAARFVGLFLALYAALAVIAEIRVGRGAEESAFQKLHAAQGTRADWIVLGASHALPLAYGDVPERLAEATGERMLVLAEPGAGPVYARFVARQALRDVAPARVLYVLDPFAFQARDWNAGRVEDRGLLRTTPLRVSTARLMADLVLRQGVDPRAMADYLTCFSKLNPPARFRTDGWEGEAAFDRTARPSRHAVESRVAYLYPEGAGLGEAGPAIDAFAALLDDARAAGAEPVVVRLPLPVHFRAALPSSAALMEELRALMAARGVPFHDLSDTLDDPTLYFDTDHLNRAGVDRLYEEKLRAILLDPGRGDRAEGAAAPD